MRMETNAHVGARVCVGSVRGSHVRSVSVPAGPKGRGREEEVLTSMSAVRLFGQGNLEPIHCRRTAHVRIIVAQVCSGGPTVSVPFYVCSDSWVEYLERAGDAAQVWCHRYPHRCLARAAASESRSSAVLPRAQLPPLRQKKQNDKPERRPCGDGMAH